MRNTVVLWDVVGDPATPTTVQVYQWQSGSPFWTGSPKSLTKVSGKNAWYSDETVGRQVTILVDSSVLVELTGIWFEGDDQPFIDF